MDLLTMLYKAHENAVLCANSELLLLQTRLYALHGMQVQTAGSDGIVSDRSTQDGTKVDSSKAIWDPHMSSTNCVLQLLVA
jgi:hypothetical protein